MTEPLDKILSGRGGAVADDNPAAEKPVTQPATEGESQTAQTTEQTGSEGEKPDRQKMVPHEALHAEKQKVKRYTEQVASFEQTLKERDAAWERRMAQLVEVVKPKTQQEPTDFFADPDAAFQQRFQGAFAPIQQQLGETRTFLVEERLYRLAGSEKAAKIEEELGKAMASGDPDIPMLASALKEKGPAAVKAIVDWYDKRTFDPNAERERLKAEVRAELLAENGGGAVQTTQAPSVMPNNFATARNTGVRNGPGWSGPQAIGSIFDMKRKA